MGGVKALWGPFGLVQRRFAKISGGLTIGAMIVLLASLAEAAGSYVISSRAESSIPGIGGTITAVAGVFGAVFTLLGWVLSILIYHVGASLFGGRGSLRRMFALGGIAYVPMLLQYSLRAVYNYAVVSTVAAPRAGQLVEFLLTHFTLFSVITLSLFAVAIVVVYGISGKRAVIVVFLPIILSIGFSLLVRGSGLGSGVAESRLGLGRIFGKSS